MPSSPKEKPKSLLIDGQIFQTPSWHRGMGKYSFSFTEALLHDRKTGATYGDIQLIFNGNLPDNDEVVKALETKFPEVSLVRLDLKVPREPRNEHSIAPTQRANRLILDEYISAKALSQSQVHFFIPALYLDEVCPVFPEAADEKMMIYYDSIPYLYHQRYGQFAGFFDNFYLPHTATVYEATKLFTISKTVANDLHVIFGLPKDVIHNINGAPIPRPSHKAAKPAGVSIESGEYILMPTGQELRKNNERAVRAFEQFRAAENLDIKLVITSTFTDEAKKDLKRISKHIIFSGNVSEPEITWLFREARFVLFPSEYEGLGLPILEAAEEGKVIACSDISVFREMSLDAFNYFDPIDVDDISRSLKKTYDETLSRTKKVDYKELLSRFTWANSVKDFYNALSKVSPVYNGKKKKVAVFCPDPSGFSAIGKVVTESHAWYSRYFDITYYFDRGPNHQVMRPNPLPYLVDCYDVEQFTQSDYERFDAVIYHIGNSEYHLNIIHTALALPGIAILHDTNIGGAYDNLLELGYISKDRYDAEVQLDALSRQKTVTSSFLTSLVNNQLAVVTHSTYAKKAVTTKLFQYDAPVEKINLPVDTPLYPEISHSLSERLNISFAGIIAKVKGTDIIEGIAESDQFTDCNVNIFGYSAVEPERLEKLRSLPHINLITNPSDYAFQTLMASSDVLVNVRLAYKGETSLTTLEAMRFGTVVIVRDFGWYSELPDAAVCKVDEPEMTIDRLGRMIRDKDGMKRLKEASVEYIEREHSHQGYAEEMAALIDRL